MPCYAMDAPTAPCQAGSRLHVVQGGFQVGTVPSIPPLVEDAICGNTAKPPDASLEELEAVGGYLVAHQLG